MAVRRVALVFGVFFAVLASAMAPAGAALEPSGHPVTTFDGDGAVRTNIAIVDTFAEARAVGIQNIGSRAGSIVLAGGYQDGFDFHIALLRLLPDGTQDFGFGTGGEVKTSIGNNDLIEDVAIQSDDKIVVAGFSDSAAMVVRYLPDGAIDTTYGGGDGYITFHAFGTRFARLKSIALQSDGKAILGGYAETDATASTSRDILVARLTTAGALDTTFGGGDGMFTRSLTAPGGDCGYPPPPNPQPCVGGSDSAAGVAVQGDGKIVFVGQTSNTAGSICNQTVNADFQSVIGRVTTAGVLDTTFDTDGLRIDGLGTTPNCPNDSFHNVTMQSDGKIVATGYANTTQDQSTNAKANISVARYNSDGSFDTSFDTDGRLATPISSTTSFLADIGEDVHILSDGKILVGAFNDNGTDNHAGTVISQLDFAAVRYTSVGALDTTFAGDGKGSYNFGQNDTLDAMTVDSSGRPILVGYSYVSGSSVDPKLAAARITTDGDLDPTFNTTGTFFKALQGGSVEHGTTVLRQGLGANAGKLIAVGDTDTGTSSQSDIAMVRYTSTGALDTSFSGDGKATADDGGRSNFPGAALVDPTDKIVVVGSSNGTSGAPRATVMRFDPDSGFDSSFSSDGIETLSIAANANQWNAVALQPDGKIVVGGAVSGTAAEWDFWVARYNATGGLDTTFNSVGHIRLNVSANNVDEIRAITVQPDGKILAVGSAFAAGNQDFALVRWNSNGSIDTSFGGGDGIVITSPGQPTNRRNQITGVAVMSDGRIVVGGNGNDGGTSSSNNVLRLARYLPNGNLDTSFDTDGIVSTNLASDRFDRVGGIALQRDEKIMVFGYSQQLFVTNDDFLIARYNWDNGALDTTYGTANQGYTLLAATTGADQAGGGVVFPDGSSALGGTAGSSDLGAARFAGDPPPVVPGAPSLDPASDSGSSNSDRITNVKRPVFNGGTCNIGDTVILRIDGAIPSTLSRSLCKTGSYSVTIAADLADGVHTISAFSRNGAGDSTNTASVTVTIDTIANPPVIVNPVQNSTHDLPPNPTISGTVDETIPGAAVTVREFGETLCSAVAAANGTWSCVAPMLPGPHTVAATQTDIAGNTSNPSTGRAFSVRSPTITNVTSSKDPTVYGESITFTATVTALAGTATGNVNFIIDDGAPQPVALSNGTASLTVPNPPNDPLDVGDHTIVADFVGSTYYLASSDTLDNDQTVNKANTTTVVTTPTNPSNFGANATFTFTVAPVAPGAGVPTGTVNVSVDGGAATPLTLAAGQATLSTTTLMPGSHTIAASFPGSSRYNASNGSLTHVVNKGATTTSVISSANPSNYGQSVTFTATVAPVSPAFGTPAGTVNFSIDGGAATPVTLVNGVAALTTAALGAGPHTVSASYVGNAVFLASSGTLANGQTVNKGATTTTVTTSGSPSVYGQNVTFTIVVAPVAPATGPRTGGLQLVIDGGTPISVVLTNGQGTYSTSTLTPGTHTVVANYIDDPNYTGSSGSVGQEVTAATTTTVLTSAKDPTVYGETVTFIATVTAQVGTAAGNVNFVIDGGSPQTVALSNGVATLTVPNPAPNPLDVGEHTAFASFLGSSNHLASSDTLDDPQTVNKAATTTVITTPTTPTAFGNSVVFTFTVAPVAPGAGVPTGTVSATIDGGTPQVLTLNSSGKATLSASNLLPGNHTIAGTYSGAPRYNASSGSLIHAVSKGATTTGVTTSKNPTTYGETVTFTATVAPVSPAFGTPTGSVAFTISGGAPTSVALVNGVATISTSTLGAGTHVISAAYSGSTQFATSSGNLPIGQTVTKGNTTTSVTTSATPTVYGQPVTFTVTVARVAPATGPLGGPTTLVIDGGTPIPLTLVNGQATYTTSALTAGSHSVVASFAGDTNYNPSSASLTQVVNPAPTSAALTSSLNPSPPGQAVTFTHLVCPAGASTNPTNAPSGSVAFKEGTTTLGSGTLAGVPGGKCAQATFTTAALSPGVHQVTGSYPGNANYAGSSITLTQTVCNQIYTGSVPGNVSGSSGAICVLNANVAGTVNVTGALLVITNSSIGGSITVNNGQRVEICGTSAGGLTVAGTSGSVRVGDPSAGCAFNTIRAHAQINNNLGGTRIGGNNISGYLMCSGNSPPPTNGGSLNTAAGRTGQCTAPF